MVRYREAGAYEEAERVMMRLSEAAVGRECFASAAALHHYMAMDALASVCNSNVLFTGRLLFHTI